MERVNIDKVYHPFITGAYNKVASEMMQETGTRVNVPPPSVNKTEIVITGEKEQVAQVAAMIRKIYEEKVSPPHDLMSFQSRFASSKPLGVPASATPLHNHIEADQLTHLLAVPLHRRKIPPPSRLR